MLRKNFPQRKAQRRVEALARQARFDTLSTEEKLSRNSAKYTKRA